MNRRGFVFYAKRARRQAFVTPNVASVFHLGRTGQNYFYAMEFVEGETLEHLIKRSGRLDVKLALEIVTQVAASLAAVHNQKLVHRDIKPSNIMVSLEEGGTVAAKIIDVVIFAALVLALLECHPKADDLNQLLLYTNLHGLALPFRYGKIGRSKRADLSTPKPGL